ncbi:hypothetical protein AHAS_Ahas09G0131400 [Arachis hypogaea]
MGSQEPLSKKLDIVVEEGVQPPKHLMVGDLKEVDREMDLIIDEFLSKMESSPMEYEVEVSENSSNEYEKKSTSKEKLKEVFKRWKKLRKSIKE